MIYNNVTAVTFLESTLTGIWREGGLNRDDNLSAGMPRFDMTDGLGDFADRVCLVDNRFESA